MGIITPPPANYRNNALVLLGDSRLAQMYNDPSHLVRNGFNFLPVGLALMGQRLKVIGSWATSGQRSDQYLSASNVAAAFATNAYWLMIYGVVNDISATGNSVDYFNTYVKPVALGWVSQGRRVILMTETGSNSFSGSASNIGAVNLYNRHVRIFARNTPGVVLFDAAALATTPTVDSQLNPSYSGDGTHVNLMAGSLALGQAFSTLMQQFIPPHQTLVSRIGEVPANGGLQVFSNPLFTTTTGGTGGTGVTGTVPAGITAIVLPSGYSASVSTSAGSYGNDLVLAITSNAAGVVLIQMDGLVGQNPTAGDVYTSSCEISLASGATGFQWAGKHLEVNKSGSTTYVEDGYCTASNVALPSGALTWTSETEELTIPSGTQGWFTDYIRVYFSASGSATLNIRRSGVWKKIA